MTVTETMHPNCRSGFSCRESFTPLLQQLVLPSFALGSKCDDPQISPGQCAELMHSVSGSKVQEKWTHGRGTAEAAMFLEPYVETHEETQLIQETQVDET